MPATLVWASHHPPVSAHYAASPSRSLEPYGIDQISAKISGTTLVHPEDDWCTGGNQRFRGILEYKEEGDTQHNEWTKVKHVPQARLVAVFDGSWRNRIRSRRVGVNSYPDTTTSSYSSASPSHASLPVSPFRPGPRGVIAPPKECRRGGGRLRPLEKQLPHESRSLWDIVTTRLLKEVSNATKEKAAIEQKQRDNAADRKRKGVERAECGCAYRHGAVEDGVMSGVVWSEGSVAARREGGGFVDVGVGVAADTVYGVGVVELSVRVVSNHLPLPHRVYLFAIDIRAGVNGSQLLDEPIVITPNDLLAVVSPSPDSRIADERRACPLLEPIQRQLKRVERTAAHHRSKVPPLVSDKDSHPASLLQRLRALRRTLIATSPDMPDRFARVHAVLARRAYKREGKGNLYVTARIDEKIHEDYKGQRIPLETFLDHLEVKLGHTKAMKARQRQYKKCAKKQHLIWHHYYRADRRMLGERMIQLTLDALGAQRVIRRCPGCGIYHREYYSFRSIGSYERLHRIIVSCLEALGQKKIEKVGF
ncbi:hypothetical protein B0H16DRAFT_1747006 [Mycena metata]|uniref:Uncharacterized protein n=1 Tax=Mycena metata TaxID=1033252 RepID=A0AAD7GV12_9AGAR|nr:hypothetical protein B0H16DRAFT_1747006 [Mycena metata]